MKNFRWGAFLPVTLLGHARRVNWGPGQSPAVDIFKLESIDGEFHPAPEADHAMLYALCIFSRQIVLLVVCLDLFFLILLFFL